MTMITSAVFMATEISSRQVIKGEVCSADCARSVTQRQLRTCVSTLLLSLLCDDATYKNRVFVIVLTLLLTCGVYVKMLALSTMCLSTCMTNARMQDISGTDNNCAGIDRCTFRKMKMFDIGLNTEITPQCGSGCQAHACWESCIAGVQWSHCVSPHMASHCLRNDHTHTQIQTHTSTAHQGDVVSEHCGSPAGPMASQLSVSIVVLRQPSVCLLTLPFVLLY